MRNTGVCPSVVPGPRGSVSAAVQASARIRPGPVRITGREIVLHAPRAHTVELAGDFTDWRPIELDPAPGGDWRVVLPVSPGLHRVAVRMDGAEWQAPPGVRGVASEFGGEVGEVMVE